MGCTHGCNVAVQAEGKLGYTHRPFRARRAEAAEAILAWARLHAESASGQVPYRLWPQAVKGHFVTRHPPLPDGADETARPTAPRDHGGGLDAAIARWGGAAADWLDLSTGINPVPYPLPPLPRRCLDRAARPCRLGRLEAAARAFWRVPDRGRRAGRPRRLGADRAAAAACCRRGSVAIPGPTYNEHEAAFRAAGWSFDGTATRWWWCIPTTPTAGRWRAADLPRRWR